MPEGWPLWTRLAGFGDGHLAPAIAVQDTKVVEEMTHEVHVLFKSIADRVALIEIQLFLLEEERICRLLPDDSDS